ncbi:flavodoxin family protein [Alkalibacter rhizosphaerae]|uniref:Flavodoxin family protein n=1 Tax=Alkalibacter rhizosphaerae TaxID=2815577 RepID=A0A974XD73_9FIRM|nr:flavodoxin family protein [Alkalibacter rhizosphaerae]QSX07692.1 flavodoxin family protein [Alkalibacter rhizosphaerae]
MKITVMIASHRRKRNTQAMVDAFLENLQDGNDIEIVNLLDKKVEICLACDYCKEHYDECIIKTDDMADILTSFKHSDLIVIATPLYFNSITSRLKIFIDRTQTLYNGWYHFKDPIFKEPKNVVILANGGSPTYPDHFLGVDVEMKHFLKNLNATVIEDLRYNNTDRNPIKENEKAQKELREAALRVKALMEKQ